ncbi:hypothetical protein [Xanthobacter sediminis]
MYSVRLLATLDRDLPPQKLGVTWERLTDVVRREVSPEAAAIFAEPVPDPALGLTYWHVATDQDPLPLMTLAPAARTRLLEELERRRAAIAAYADSLAAAGGDTGARLAAGLRSALVVPDLDAHVWSVDGRPVIAAWGREVAAAGPAFARIEARLPSPPVPAPAGATITSAQPHAAAEAPGEAPAPVRRRPWWLLWLLFAALAGVLYYQLLAACALDLPIIGKIANRCPGTGQGELRALMERNDSLRSRLRQAELRTAQGAEACPAAGKAPAGDRTDNTGPADRAPQSEEVRKRVEDRRGSRGRFNVTLSWNGIEDLDLHVFCPGGHIFFGHEEACGGRLEIDENRKPDSTRPNPVEHVSWASDPPAGEYVVAVKFFDRRGRPARPVPFVVLLTAGDQVRRYDGIVANEKDQAEVVRLRR